LGEKLYTQPEALEMTQILAGAYATATVLEATLEKIQQQTAQEKENGSQLSQGFGLDRAHPRPGVLSIDKALFTNNGIKNKNDSVIGMLYEVGLPFVSSVDGRRFATQLELSKHLDVLFKRNQLEKSIARTEERGWYDADFVWTGEKNEQDIVTTSAEQSMEIAGHSSDDGYNPNTSKMPADETRDRCVVCGINFKMVFDNDDGIYMYSNCREIEMLNDDAADVESEQVLVHVTCWRGLGSPQVLTADQALHDVRRH
jgi:pre-mRNA cleavage complex 2 protein Pcf11